MKTYRIRISETERRLIIASLKAWIDPLPGTKKLIEQLEFVPIRSRSVRGEMY